jgi:hypothetical protein
MQFHTITILYVSVPSDAFDSREYEERYAIDQARESSRTWCIPAAWEAQLIREGYENVYRVVRYSTLRKAS